MPPPCSRITGMTALLRRSAPKTFASKTVRTSSTVSSSTEPIRIWLTQLTTASRRPSRATTSFTHAATDASSVICMGRIGKAGSPSKRDGSRMVP